MTWKWTEKRWVKSFVLVAMSTTAAIAAWAGEAPAVGSALRSSAEIRLYVPAGARIWFDGHETAQTGAERLFISPPLEAGRDFAYEVRVQWQDGKRLVERTRRLAVQAGDHIGLDHTERGFVEVRAYSSEAPRPAPSPVIRDVSVYYREPAASYYAPSQAETGIAERRMYYYVPGQAVLGPAAVTPAAPRALPVSAMGNQNFPVMSQ